MNPCQYVLKAEVPKYIPIADKPLNLGGKISYFTIDEFQKQFGFTYNDSISIDSKSRINRFSENIVGDVSASQLNNQVEKVLKTTLENLVICNMGQFGYGVFATKSMRKNTVVAIYAGTITEGFKVSDASDHALGYYGTNMSFSTKYHRGIASFMQHLPEEPRFPDASTLSKICKLTGQDVSEDKIKLNVELYSTEFESADIRELVLTENIRREYLNFKNIPVVAMVTMKDVKSGDQLGFNYGCDYWLSRKVIPEFFGKHGNTIPHVFYKKNFGQLNFDDFTYTGPYKSLIESLKKRKASVTVIGDDKKPHDVSAGKLMCLLLNANARELKIHPLVYEEAYQSK